MVKTIVYTDINIVIIYQVIITQHHSFFYINSSTGSELDLQLGSQSSTF
jgi:hypothetical protein